MNSNLDPCAARPARRSPRFLTVGLAWLLAVSALPAFASPDGSSYEPMSPVRCNGYDRVEIRGRHIRATDAAVSSQGYCTVRIYDSLLEADGIAVVAQGRSKIEIFDSQIEGGRGALRAAGQSRIVLQRTRTAGGATIQGQGSIEDLSGQLGPAEIEQTDYSFSVGAGGIELRSGETKMSIGVGGIRMSDGEETGDDEAAQDGGSDSVELSVGGITLRTGGARSTEAWRAQGPELSSADAARVLVELGATAQGDQLHLRMAGDVLFDSDSAAIRADAARELAKVAQVIRHGAVGGVGIVGHTDSVASEAYNQRLSEQRALAVARWLAENEGIPPQLMRAIGAGESRPVAHNTLPDGSDDPAGRARNRRVEIHFEAGDEVLAAIAAPDTAPSLATGEVPPSCARICDAWPRLSELEARCVVASLEGSGYRVLGTTGCVAIEETATCRLCWRTLDVSENDCAATSRACLGR